MDAKLNKKRYYITFFLFMGIYMVGMIGVSLVRKYMDVPIYAIYGLTLVPIVALLFAIAAQWRFVNGLDEYLRGRQIKAMMFALALILSISASWGILEIILDVPQLPSLWFIVIFCFAYGPAEAYLNFKDKKHD